MLDPSLIDENNNLLHSKTLLKKYWLMSQEEKINYINNYKNKNVVLLSHDTDLSYIYKNITVQIVCNDLLLMNFFAFRFEKLHKTRVINQVKTIIDNTDNNFVQDYKESLINWQNHHNEFTRFDISNITSDIFLDDFSNFFKVTITREIENIFNDWKIKQKEIFSDFFK